MTSLLSKPKPTIVTAYPHLHPQPGVDLKNVNKSLLDRAEALGRRLGKPITITSGYRSRASQQYLWDNAARLGLVRGKTVAPPGGSLHQGGYALDLAIDGRPIQDTVSASVIRSVGLYPLPGDAPHVQLVPPGTSLAAAKAKYGDNTTPGSLHFLPGTKAPKFDVSQIPDVAAGGVAGHVTDPSKLVVEAIAAALGTSGPRLLLYTALIVGGAVLIVAGVARATGLDKKAASAAKAAAVAAVIPK